MHQRMVRGGSFGDWIRYSCRSGRCLSTCVLGRSLRKLLLQDTFMKRTAEAPALHGRLAFPDSIERKTLRRRSGARSTAEARWCRTATARASLTASPRHCSKIASLVNALVLSFLGFSKVKASLAASCRRSRARQSACHNWLEASCRSRSSFRSHRCSAGPRPEAPPVLLVDVGG